MPAAKVGGSWRLSRAVLEEFIAARSTAVRPHALILEPSEDERDRLAAYARRHAGRVTATGDPDEAIDSAVESDPDILFLAVTEGMSRMPAEIIDRMREGGVTPRVVLMVSRDRMHLAADPLDYGPAILLRRPVERADVASVLALITG